MSEGTKKDRLPARKSRPPQEEQTKNKTKEEEDKCALNQQIDLRVERTINDQIEIGVEETIRPALESKMPKNTIISKNKNTRQPSLGHHSNTRKADQESKLGQRRKER